MKPSSLSINYTHAEPHFDEPLPELCPSKPNFIDSWTICTVPDDDVEGCVFEYFQRHTSDGLTYIVDLEESVPIYP